MTPALQASQEEQSSFTEEHDVAGASDQNSNDSFDSEENSVDHSNDSFDSEETSVDHEEDHFSDSDSLNTSKIPCSNERYAEELTNAAIYQDSVEAGQMGVSMKPGKQGSRCGMWSDAVRQATNEIELVSAIDQHLLKDINQMKTLNTRWRYQHKFSDQLGQPKPDFTFGLPFDPLSQTYPQVCDLRREYISLIRPLPRMALPVVCIEVKGPSGPLWQAVNQSRHNAACGIKNIVGIKRAAGQAPATYENRDLSKSIEITTESVQVTRHRMEVRNGADCYFSKSDTWPLNIHQHSEIKKLITSVLDWGQKLQKELLKDLKALESRLGKEKVDSLKRTRSMSALSASEADEEQVVTKAVKKQKRAR